MEFASVAFMILMVLPVQYCGKYRLGADWYVNSTKQYIDCIFYGCWKRIGIRIVHGWIYSRNLVGTWRDAFGRYFRKKARIRVGGTCNFKNCSEGVFRCDSESAFDRDHYRRNPARCIYCNRRFRNRSCVFGNPVFDLSLHYMERYSKDYPAVGTYDRSYHIYDWAFVNHVVGDGVYWNARSDCKCDTFHFGQQDCDFGSADFSNLYTADFNVFTDRIGSSLKGE